MAALRMNPKTLLMESYIQHLPRVQVRFKEPAVGLAWGHIKERLQRTKEQEDRGKAGRGGHPTRPWLKPLFSLSPLSRGFKQK